MCTGILIHYERTVGATPAGVCGYTGTLWANSQVKPDRHVEQREAVDVSSRGLHPCLEQRVKLLASPVSRSAEGFH